MGNLDGTSLFCPDILTEWGENCHSVMQQTSAECANLATHVTNILHVQIFANHKQVVNIAKIYLTPMVLIHSIRCTCMTLFYKSVFFL